MLQKLCKQLSTDSRCPRRSELGHIHTKISTTTLHKLRTLQIECTMMMCSFDGAHTSVLGGTQVQTPRDCGGLGGSALYIHTEGPAPISRLREMAEARHASSVGAISMSGSCDSQHDSSTSRAGHKSVPRPPSTESGTPHLCVIALGGRVVCLCVDGDLTKGRRAMPTESRDIFHRNTG